MRDEKIKKSFRLHLLALILALAIAWYSINPTPHNIIPRQPEDDQADAQKRDAEPQLSRPPLSLQLYTLQRREPLNALHSANEETDDFDWPEFIDG